MTMPGKLFVVTVASEKGGVGKTTIATNLAVYLKALREDLPVTIASFDNHFSVDNMFAIDRTGKGSVAGLLNSRTPHRQLCLGEYGVQYFPSERTLPPLRGQVEKLGEKLAATELEGVLILDTRPILDEYTISALLAADLVLVPVKDRASLVNAGALRQARAAYARAEEQFWLVPSLIDGRLRLQGEIGMHEYLRCNAQERDYQVFDGYIAKSPKVEGLASGFSSRIPAIITHARGTQVHRQFRQLADFVLRQFDQARSTRASQGRSEQLLQLASPGAVRRLQVECPVCRSVIYGDEGEMYLHLRSRRRGFIHGGCLRRLLAGTEMQPLLQDSGLLVLDVTGRGLGGGRERFQLSLHDRDGAEQVSEMIGQNGQKMFAAFLAAVTAMVPEEMVRDLVLVTLSDEAPAGFLSGPGRARFRALRRSVLRALPGRGD
jgi:chromosome partitioning protein